MANKKLFKSLVGKLMPQTDTVNQAGGKAYQMAPKEALAQFAVTGTFNQTFYTDAESQLAEVLDLVNEVEAPYIAKLALYSRNQAHMKDMPAFLLAVLSVKDGALFEMIFNKVITNGRMLRNFVQIMRSGVIGRKSLGTRPKRLVKEWLDSRDEKSLFGDSIGNDPSLADIIKMVHPKPQSSTRKAFYAYLIGKDYDKKHLPEIVKAYEAFKAGKGKLPDVPFQMLTSFDLSKEDWQQIAANASWQMTRMNLNTFARHGVYKDKELTETIAARIQNAELIKRSRVFPYQLMMAWKMTDAGVPGIINDALSTAMEVAVKNVPVFNGKIYVCIDVSGSMTSPVTGYRQGASSKVRCIDAAALLGAAILHNNPEAELLPFDTKVVNLKLNCFDSVITNADKLASIFGGGTSCSAPFAELNRQKADGDLVIMVSDNQSWADRSRGKVSKMMSEWRKFKSRNSEAKLVCIDIQPYANSQVKDEQDVLNIGGFSDQVFKTIDTFHREGFEGQTFIREIEAVKL